MPSPPVNPRELPENIHPGHLFPNGKLLKDEAIAKAKQQLRAGGRHRISVAGSRVTQKNKKNNELTVLKVLDPNTKRERFYAMYPTKPLGKGCFGHVSLMQDLDSGDWFAIKIQNVDRRKNPTGAAMVEKEYRNLLRMKESTGAMWEVADGQERFMIAMKLAPGKNMHKSLIENPNLELPESRWLKIGKNITGRFAELHQNGLIHLDIKADNINHDMKTDKISVLDLGLAVLPNQSPTMVGAAPFRAPELNKSPPLVSKACDVYSLCLTLGQVYRMAEFVRTGRKPPLDQRVAIMGEKNPALNKCRFPTPEIRNEVYRFLRSGTDPNPSKRPSMQEANAFFKTMEERCINALKAKGPSHGHLEIQNILVKGNQGEFQSSRNLTKSRTTPTAPLAIEPNQTTSDPVPRMAQYITGLAAQAKSEHLKSLSKRQALGKQAPLMTRLILDEFSLYPKDKPLSIDQYKNLIAHVHKLASTLPPNINLILATIPVLWPDKTVHNSVLNVQSPMQSGQPPLIHHFAKQVASAVDFRYADRTGREYPLSPDNYNSAYSPNKVLANTGVTLNDPNQFHGALKVTASNGESFLSSTEVCLDHKYSVADTNLRKLISQLGRNHKEIPLHVTHVVTSCTINVDKQNLLATVVHADPVVAKIGATPFARGSPMTARSFGQGGEMQVFPPRPIGACAGNILNLITAADKANNIPNRVNAKDADGKTLLHRVLEGYKTSEFNHVHKRVESLLKLGANGSLADKSNITPIMLLDNIIKNSKNPREIDALNLLKRTMVSAIANHKNAIISSPDKLKFEAGRGKELKAVPAMPVNHHFRR